MAIHDHSMHPFMSKHQPLEEVTDTELAILGVLWEHGPTPIREITQGIYSQHSPALHATVKSLLDRLMEKGYVTSDKSRFAHLFSAVISRETYVAAQLQRLANNHFQGSLTPMLMALVERVKLKNEDRQRIQQIIDSIPK